MTFHEKIDINFPLSEELYAIMDSPTSSSSAKTPIEFSGKKKACKLCSETLHLMELYLCNKCSFKICRSCHQSLENKAQCPNCRSTNCLIKLDNGCRCDYFNKTEWYLYTKDDPNSQDKLYGHLFNYMEEIVLDGESIHERYWKKCPSCLIKSGEIINTLYRQLANEYRAQLLITLPKEYLAFIHFNNNPDDQLPREFGENVLKKVKCTVELPFSDAYLEEQPKNWTVLIHESD